MDFPEWVTVIKDFATIVTLLVGLYGINTWRKQLTAKAEYDLARRLLIGAYKVRDELSTISVVVSINQKFTGKQLNDLFVKLKANQANLEVEMLEAEAMWGNQAVFKILKTFISIGREWEWYFGIGPFLGEEIQLGPDVAEDIIFKEVEEVITEIENLLRPKLRHK